MGIYFPDWHDFNAAQAGVFRTKRIVIFTINGAGVGGVRVRRHLP